MSLPLRRAAAILLLVGIVALPAGAAQTILRALDRRAIPMLVSKGSTMNRYGTGVIVGPSVILTAKHVVGTTMEVRLLKGKPIRAQAVCRTREEDLAVVKAALPRGTPYYILSAKTPKVGEAVRVGGYPGRQWTAAGGRVTHVISSAILGGRRIRSPMIVFTPALHQGASGSPVLNRRGEVVGIFVASNRAENYSIAFPAATALRACRNFLR